MIDRTNEFVARIALNLFDKSKPEQTAVIRTYPNATQMAIFAALNTLKDRKARKRT